MTYLQPLKNLLFIVIFSVSITSCSKEDIGVDGSVASITVKLKSDTHTLDKVYVDIQDVQLKVIEDGSQPGAWISLEALNTGTHDVCKLGEDNPLLLVDHLEVETHYVYEIRLVLGDNNFMDINNTLHYLEVSHLGNATPSNLIKTQLKPNRHYDLVIDVDVDASVSYNEDEHIMVLNPKLYTAIRQIKY